MTNLLIVLISMLLRSAAAGIISRSEQDTPISITATVTVDWLYPPQKTSSSLPSPSSPPAGVSDDPWTMLSTIGYGIPSTTAYDVSEPYVPPPASSSSREFGSIITFSNTCYYHTVIESSVETESPTPETTLVRTRPFTITTLTTTAYSTVYASAAMSESSPTSTSTSCVSGKQDIACHAGMPQASGHPVEQRNVKKGVINGVSKKKTNVDMEDDQESSAATIGLYGTCFAVLVMAFIL